MIKLSSLISFRWRKFPRTGSALLLALGLVVLLTLLVASFLTIARLDYSSSTYYAREVNTKLLSETALNLVMAQISQATKSIDALAGSTVAWASQPGMIRTFDTSGNAVSDYKLYSWDNMAVAATSFNQGAETAPTGWDTQKGIWTDLNEPIQTTASGPIYPIIQGSNSVAGISLQAGLTDIYGNAVPGKSYHLATDSGPAGALADVEGFHVNSAPVQTGASPANPDVPMPVKWLYILQDGTTVAAQTSGSSTTAASVPGATKSNKIVGRIAFWTDDETCKVNINTASEGNFWDVPLADGREERTLAVNIPVQGEYQRIPGHPATVSLSSVFGAENQFFPSTWNAPNQVNLAVPGDDTTLKNLYGMTPRMTWGGTLFGTNPYTLSAESATTPAYFPYTNNAMVTLKPTPTITPVANRLYSTVDELLFQPTTSPTPTRTPNTNMTAASLAQVKFFLTADSVAPEVTLFNTPRVSIWPITWPNTGVITGSNPSIPVTNPAPDPLANNPFYTSSSAPMLMPEEKLLAFCGTLNGFPYYFQRQDSYDTLWDYSSITRNQQLISYLDAMTSQNVPGFGGSFTSKYGSDAPQIITEIFDYIRSGPNLNNSVAGTSGYSGTLSVNYNYAPIANRDLSSTNNGTVNNGGSGLAGGGSVVPITITHGGVATHGSGRFPTVTEAALVFYAVDRKDPNPGTNTSADPSSPTAGKWEFIGPVTSDPLSGSQTTLMGVYLLLNVYNPETGAVCESPYFITQFTSASPFSINGNPINTVDQVNTGSFPESSTLKGESLMNFLSLSTTGGASSTFDSFTGSTWTMASQNKGLGAKDLPKALNHKLYSGTSGTTYPYFATVIPVNPHANTFTFTGTSCTLTIAPVKIGAANFPAGNTEQTITLDFSKLNGTYPIPVAPEFNNEKSSADNSVALSTVPSTVTVPAIEKYDNYYYYFSRLNLPPTSPVDASAAAPAYPWTGTYATSCYTFSPPASPVKIYWDMRNLLARNVATQTRTSLDSKLSGGNPESLLAEAYNSSGNVADTIISLRLNPDPTKQGGDARLVALNANPPSNWFVPHYAMSKLQAASFPIRGAHSLTVGQNMNGPSIPDAYTVGYIRYESMFGYPVGGYPNFSQPYVSTMGSPTSWVGQNTTNVPGISGLTPVNPIVGDFNNGFGGLTDGAIIPKPDDTTSSLAYDTASGDTTTLETPYYEAYPLQTSQPYFSPARQLSGPVAFGVLPSGVQAGVPWRTLAFNPNPIAGSTHIGLQSPKDHLLLDLFWMPVVEPYAISEPLSTAGKINMNYEIEPFTYINRQTALYAAMKADKVFAIPSAASTVYKTADTNCGGPSNVPTTGGFKPAVNTWSFHFPIDILHTLQQFDTVFSSGNIFRSASQICEIFLQPRANPLYTPPSTFTLPSPDTAGSTANISAWWSSGNANTNLTGANGRQQPYAHLYSLLTTKSNTFEVHMRVQVLTKNSATDPATFDESAGDTVVGEYRGSAIIERYIDANNTKLPDFSTTFTNAGQNTLDSYYSFRVVSTKAFTPY